MKCPHCNDELILRAAAWYNVEQYGSSAKVFTICCQQPITLSRVVSFRATPTEISGEDDWGFTQDDERMYQDL